MFGGAVSTVPGLELAETVTGGLVPEPPRGPRSLRTPLGRLFQVPAYVNEISGLDTAGAGFTGLSTRPESQAHGRARVLTYGSYTAARLYISASYR